MRTHTHETYCMPPLVQAELHVLACQMVLDNERP